MYVCMYVCMHAHVRCMYRHTSPSMLAMMHMAVLGGWAWYRVVAWSDRFERMALDTPITMSLWSSLPRWVGTRVVMKVARVVTRCGKHLDLNQIFIWFERRNEKKRERERDPTRVDHLIMNPSWWSSWSKDLSPQLTGKHTCRRRAIGEDGWSGVMLKWECIAKAPPPPGEF